MTSPGRLKDLGDVQKLIRILNLDTLFSEKVNPYVREKYIEMWQGVKTEQNNSQRSF